MKQFGSTLSEFGLIQVKSEHETVRITTGPSLVSFRKSLSMKQFGSPLSEFGLIQVKSEQETVWITTVRVWSYSGKV